MARPLPLSRRAVLCGMSAAAAISSAPVAAAMPKVADRKAWDAAMRHLERCKAEVDAFTPRVDRVNDAYARLRAKVPHIRVKLSTGSTVSTDNEALVTFSRISLKGVMYVEPVAYDLHRDNMAIVDAADSREARFQRIDERLGWTAINDRYDALVERMCEAQEALLRLPAPDGEAAMVKVDMLWPEVEGIHTDNREEQLYADLRRFLLGAAQ